MLGKRADRAPRPILLYAKLEIIAAVLAAMTPGFLWLTRKAYIAAGGSAAVSPVGATALRLLLTTVVLFAPTFVMGGTLPAAARGIETERDTRRRGVGLLYGCNTLGAVFGCVLANFVLLEAVGTRSTLWVAAAANLAIALVARSMGQEMPARRRRVSTATPSGSDAEPAPKSRRPRKPGSAPAFVLAASGAVGFAFFLMELVWYRMLGPLLGGTVFTFGIILAVALFGIGLGGACYSFFGSERQATLSGFALTCLLEAFFIALPYALGDRVAAIALLLRPLGQMQFSGLALGWTIVTAIVVLPASFMAGVQFPMLIALLGRGRDRVGSHTGLAYAANTGGAIAGALAGGFGLLPALTVLGCVAARRVAPRHPRRSGGTVRLASFDRLARRRSPRCSSARSSSSCSKPKARRRFGGTVKSASAAHPHGAELAQQLPPVDQHDSPRHPLGSATARKAPSVSTVAWAGRSSSTARAMGTRASTRPRRSWSVSWGRFFTPA